MRAYINFLTLFLLLLFSINSFAATSKNILIINSYHRGFQWSDDVIKGIEKVIYSSNINSKILYMDSKRISSEKYYKELKDLYKLQLEKEKYDLVVAVDKFAYDFILKNYSEIFTNELILSVGAEQFSIKEVKKYNLQNKVSVILEKRAILEISEIILKLIPKLKKLYIINDNSENGDDSDIFIKNTINKINSKVEVNYIRSSTILELKEKFSKKRANEAVFFIRFYNNKYGKLYRNSEIAELIDNSAIPVFTTDTLFLNKGSTGGKLVPIEKLGIYTGKNILSIINGKIKVPFVKTFDIYKYIFDYKKLHNFKLNIENLNFKTEYVNSPETFFNKHRKLIDSVFLISPFLLFLIAGLIHNIYLRIKSAKLLKQRMEFDKVLLDAIESPIVWQDDTGRIVDSNSRFCNLMELPCPKIKGKTLKDYLKKITNANSLVDALKKFVNNTLENNEVTLKNTDNKEQIYLINQTKYTEDVYKSSGTVTIFTDITKERFALREKIKHQEFIIQQSKLAEIGEIFSSIAHQWKSPLVEIATIAQEQLYNENGDEKKSKYVNDTMIQVKYMTETISNFQEFIMPSSKKIRFDISEAVYRMMSIIEHNIKFNYIDVNITVEENTNLMVWGYKNELMQILLNIVNNAKDAIIKNKKKGGKRFNSYQHKECQ